jgi:trehalose 6-phosphate synthase
MSGRLVVVSNRLADPTKPAAGGLAVALSEALKSTGGLWFGWSGEIVDPADGGKPGECKLTLQQVGNVDFAAVNLSREDHDTYYLGYSNRVLWPVFHYRLDLADFNPSFIAGYQRVNRMFAKELMSLLRDDDVIWVHDYHLIPLAAELRALGSKHRIGFFLHIPFPPQLVLAAMPGNERLMRSLFAYDVVGMQSEADMVHFRRYVVAEGNAEMLAEDTFRAFSRTLVARAFPIGIDVDEFLALAEQAEAQEGLEMLRDQYSKRKLLLGVDRLDYSKGIPQRVRAFRELLEKYPDTRMSATLIQIASPSREDVDAYDSIRRELDSLCGEINGLYGELDWMPIRYIHRTVARARLPGLYRASRVALVTPLRDGMNLVAKEFVVAQDPDDPGVLVLSRFAGAAERMTAALMVNPYDTEGTADVIYRALKMDKTERIRRHRALLDEVKTNDVHSWCKNFLDALHGREVVVEQTS